MVNSRNNLNLRNSLVVLWFRDLLRIVEFFLEYILTADYGNNNLYTPVK